MHNTMSGNQHKIFSTMLTRASSLSLGLSLALSGCGKPESTTPPGEGQAAAPEPQDKVAKAPERSYPTPPAPTSPRPVNFPDVQAFKMDNGLEVFIVENHEVPIVSAQLVVKAGTSDES